jgi:sugar-specific transcriptional regulator TrmB
MNKLFADFFETGLKDIKFKFSDLEAELPKPTMIEEKPTHTKIFYDLEPEEEFELPKGSFDEFKTKFDTHIKKLKSIKFQIPTQLKEIYLDLVAKLENILNYIEDVAVGLFAEFVEYINRFIEWLTGPTQRTADEILIEIKDVNETVELMQDYVKK